MNCAIRYRDAREEGVRPRQGLEDNENDVGLQKIVSGDEEGCVLGAMLDCDKRIRESASETSFFFAAALPLRVRLAKMLPHAAQRVNKSRLFIISMVITGIPVSQMSFNLISIAVCAECECAVFVSRDLRVESRSRKNETRDSLARNDGSASFGFGDVAPENKPDDCEPSSSARRECLTYCSFATRDEVETQVKTRVSFFSTRSAPSFCITSSRDAASFLSHSLFWARAAH